MQNDTVQQLEFYKKESKMTKKIFHIIISKKKKEKKIMKNSSHF